MRALGPFDIIPSVARDRLRMPRALRVPRFRSGALSQPALSEAEGSKRAVRERGSSVPRYATPFFVYIVRCADESFYTGMTSELELRLAEHQEGLEPKAYTFSRRPIELVWSQDFPNHDEAFRVERQIKGWSRAKKEA